MCMYTHYTDTNVTLMWGQLLPVVTTLFMVLRDVWYYVVGKERGCSPVIGRKQEMITDYRL